MTIRLSDHFSYKRLLRFTLPSIMMLVFTSIYSVVDGFFVSNYVGKTAFAAVNLIMPYVMLLGCMGFMIGTGGVALVSRVLGEGDEARARKYFSMLTELAVLLGALISLGGYAALTGVARMLGASGEILDGCLTYGRILLPFNMIFMLQVMFQSFLICAERPQLGLYVTVGAGVTNMFLDWLFVGLWNFGVEGAAWATVLSQCVGGLTPLIYFLLPNTGRLRLRFAKMEFRPLWDACYNGVSELMSSIAMSVVGMAYNLNLLKYAGANGVAAYGVLMYVSFVFAAIFIGYSIGVEPVVGYHYGARNRFELKNLLTKSMKLMLGGGVCMAMLAQICAGSIAKIFVGYDAELCAMTVQAFRLFSFSFLLSGCNIFTSSFFTALGNGTVSATCSFLRTLVFELLCVELLPIFFGLTGIWCAIGVAELCAALVGLIFLAALRRHYGYWET